MKKLFVALGCILLSFSAVADDSNNFSVNVNTIEVWVKVQSDKQDVRHLTQSDFQIYEDDRKMNLNCFEEHTATTAEQLSPETAQSSPTTETATAQGQNQKKKVILFLDLLNTSQAEYGVIQPRLHSFLDQIKPNNWDVMLASFMPDKKLGVAVPFTNQMGRINSAIDHFIANPGRDLPIVKNQRELQREISQILLRGRAAENAVDDAYRLAQDYAKEDRDRTLLSLDALQGFGRYLKGLHLQDHLVIVFVSGGFDSDPGRRYFDMVDKVVSSYFDTNSSAAAMRSSNWIKPSNLEILNEIHRSVGTLNQSNVTLYSINTRGMYLSGHDAAAESIQTSTDDMTTLQDVQATLSAIAQDTGGLTFENSLNFGKGFDAILTDLQHEYLLCYNAPSHEKHGAYHKIKVTGPKGYDLRYRKGYVD